ncbi:MAG: sigma-E processing peptidase SpoIIGA [Clostridia bacterium]|nr:sigma-E processing peptidase SpoIIGA [Clostridia bacterium]
MTVYADIAFIFNFAMDLLALKLAAKLMKWHPPSKRLWLAATLAALYATGIYWLPAFLFSLPAKACFGLLVACLAFTPVGKGALLRAWGFTLLANILLSGLAELAFALGGGVAPTVPFWLVWGTAVAALPAYSLWVRLRPPRSHVPLVVTFAEGTCRFDAFVDSGCLLTHPDTGLPAVIISQDRLPFTPQTPLRVPYTTVEGGGELPALLPLYACVGGRQVHICVALCQGNTPTVVPARIVAEI